MNFGGCQLWVQLSQAFLHQFWKFLCSSCCKFSETHSTFWICMILKDVMEKKNGNQKICQFEPTLKSNLFGDWDFLTFFSIRWPKSTRMKNRPYWMVKKSPKHQKKSKNEGFRGTYCIPPFWEHPVWQKVPVSAANG